jgi:hypothetical protein
VAVLKEEVNVLDVNLIENDFGNSVFCCAVHLFVLCCVFILIPHLISCRKNDSFSDSK